MCEARYASGDCLTLNITLAARWMMAQSSDFRLTRTDTGQAVSETAQKQVVLQYWGWAGLICYTGIAQWNRHDTAAWLQDVLTHEPGERTPRQVLDEVVREANGWLSAVPIAKRYHSFTLISYEKRIPHVYVASTFERVGGPPLQKPQPTLMVSHLRPRRPRTVVTGWAPAVQSRQRAALEDVLARNPEPESLRRALALVSRDAATRAQGTVGESCVVAHLLPDGSGEAQVFGNLTAEYLPTLISHGMDMSVHVPTASQQSGASGPMRLVGVTWNGNSEASAMLAAFRELGKQSGDGWPDVGTEGACP